MYYLRIYMPSMDKVCDVECDSLARAQYVMENFLGAFEEGSIIRDNLESARIINEKTGETYTYFSIIYTNDWENSL